ncbi:MAG: hypothetical protein E7161_01780 [Firmicutes bacterium]|nr:hypothetical protein [Bacillota bacterium]
MRLKKQITTDVINNIQITEYESEGAEIIESDEHPDTPYWNFIKMKLIDVDFKSLKEKNTDTVS